MPGDKTESCREEELISILVGHKLSISSVLMSTVVNRFQFHRTLEFRKILTRTKKLISILVGHKRFLKAYTLPNVVNRFQIDFYLSRTQAY